MTKDWIKEGLQSQPPKVFLSALWWGVVMEKSQDRKGQSMEEV